MSLRRRPTVILLTLCLLIMQVQVWASVTLGCRHAAGTSGMTADCSLHESGTPMPAPRHDGLFDCHQCALHCLMTVAIPASSLSPIQGPRGPRARVSGIGLHFYEFIPALLEPPPRV